MASQLIVGGVRLMAMFQQYESDDPIISGELLTRPDVTGSIETFFASLDIIDHFAILDWHLDLSEMLNARCGAKVAINIHNLLVEREEDRGIFLERIARQSTAVTFEFTETHPMPAVEPSNRMLSRIRESGHRSALDDFGTGYNGMSMFTDYDFDIVKFDRSLTADLTRSSDDLRTIRLLRQMLDELGKAHVAEGVESQEIHRILLDAGFTTFQGYLFHAPRSVDEFINERSIQR